MGKYECMCLDIYISVVVVFDFLEKSSLDYLQYSDIYFFHSRIIVTKITTLWRMKQIWASLHLKFNTML